VSAGGDGSGELNGGADKLDAVVEAEGVPYGRGG